MCCLDLYTLKSKRKQKCENYKSLKIVDPFQESALVDPHPYINEYFFPLYGFIHFN